MCQMSLVSCIIAVKLLLLFLIYSDGNHNIPLQVIIYIEFLKSLEYLTGALNYNGLIEISITQKQAVYIVCIHSVNLDLMCLGGRKCRNKTLCASYK